MKHPPTAALLCLCAALLLAACAATEAPAETVPPHGDTAADALRARYEAELAALREELAALRAEDTATRADYEARIESLESTLAHLCGEGADPAESQKIPEITASATVAPPRETAAPPWVDSDETPEMTAFHYRIEGDTAVICAYTGVETHVVIPADMDGYPVTRIADNAFAGTGVRTVTVPAGVKRIGWFAFYGCTALEAISLPASVEVIDYGAFDVCPALTVYAPANSYAAAFATAYGYAWVATE